MAPQKLWSDKDTLAARALMRRNASNVEFISTIGRTKSAAYARIKWLDDPRERARLYENSRRSRAGDVKRVVQIFERTQGRIPEHVLADALRRNGAERSITALICGDPAPGQSALDHRQSGVS